MLSLTGRENKSNYVTNGLLRLILWKDFIEFKIPKSF